MDQAFNVLRSLDNFHKIEIKEGERLVFVGDIHGQFDDLIRIFETNNFPSISNKYVIVKACLWTLNFSLDF